LKLAGFLAVLLAVPGFAMLSPWIRNRLRPNKAVSRAGIRINVQGPVLRLSFRPVMVQRPRGMGPIPVAACSAGLFFPRPEPL